MAGFDDDCVCPISKRMENSIKGDLYIVIIVEKEVSHYWKYEYQQYNAYSLRM
jgi:hypothetical protein